MVTFWTRFLTCGLLLSAVGCGGGDKSQPAAQENAAQPGAMAAADGQMPGGPGGPPAGAPEGAPQAAVAPVAPAKPAYDGPSPTEFIPPSLKQAIGVRLSAISDPAHPLHKVLFDQFQPITTLLARVGIKPQGIEAVWVGSNRETDDVLLFVRTTEKMSQQAICKTLQAETPLDKIGKAEVFKLPNHPLHQNAVAFLDAQTLLLGRMATVTDALKNPKAGSIRLGLEAAKAHQSLFWLSQDPGTLQRELAKNTNEAVAGLMAQAFLPKGFAVAIAPTNTGTTETSPGGTGAAGASAAGAPPGTSAGVQSTSSDAIPGAAGAPAGASPPGGRPASADGIPGAAGAPAGASPTAPGSGNTGGSSGTVDPNAFELSVGVSFDSEATSDAVEKQIKAALQLFQQSGGASAGAELQPPPQAGAGGAGMRLGVVGAGAGAGAPAGAAAGAPAGAGGAGARGAGAPAGAGAGAAAQRPPAGMRPQNAGNAGAGAAPNISSLTTLQVSGSGGTQAAISQIVMSVISTISVTHEREKLRVTTPLPVPENATPVPLLGFVLQTAGASALGDGLFEGSLDLLAKGMQQWGTTKPDSVLGVSRVGQLPLRAGYSWMTLVLPYIGRDDIYSQFDFKKSWDDPQNRLPASQAIPAFLNPADSRTNWSGSNYAGLGLSHFVGVSGVEDTPDVIAATLNRSDPRAGVFGYDRVARPNEITDGQGQTIMIIGSGGLASPWVMGGGATIRGARAPYLDDLRGFGSRGLPKSGAFAVFADGSSRIISAEIDPAVFKAMCTIHGNEKGE